MGGGGGLGLFAGTIGSQKTDAFARGVLVAAAAQLGTVSDAGSRATETSGSSLRDILEYLRPWWTYPYGHPKKTQEIEQLQRALKKPLEGFSSGYLTMDALDLKGKALIELGKGIKELYQKKNVREAKKNKK